MTVQTESVTPWYKQFWPWFIISIPVASIIYSMVMITFALTTPHALVSDDYYKDGLNVNQVLTKDRVATQMGLQAELTVIHQGSSTNLQIRLSGNLPKQQYDFILLKLEHPTLPEKDQTLQLVASGQNRFLIQLAEPLKGRWYATIVPPENNWRLVGPLAFPFTQTIIGHKLKANVQPDA